jgi:ABC-type lipoprotein export system ATPase subunit
MRWAQRRVVFQFSQLLPALTVLENPLLPVYYTGNYEGQRRHRPRLEVVALSGRSSKQRRQRK